MTDEEIIKLIDDTSSVLVSKSGEIDKGAMLVLCREVERTTRADAARTAFRAANAISHREDISKMLDRLESMEHQQKSES